MATLKFRPQQFSKKFALRHVRKYGAGYIANYNRQERRHTEKSLYRIGGQLHYLGSHAPYSVRKKWKIAESKFMNRYRKTM